jgi:hypothetical protein
LALWSTNVGGTSTAFYRQPLENSGGELFIPVDKSGLGIRSYWDDPSSEVAQSFKVRT